MPLPPLNDPAYLKKQYHDAANLEARIQLHLRFSVNKYRWHPWVFDHLNLPAQCRILELGCGPGYLWQENIQRIPPGWEITLSDFSAGMLANARCALEKQRPFQFKVIDAQSIPLEAGSFDAIIANHMLYHVPDLPAALAEIRRVLRPGGQFYAATNGERHLGEIAEVVAKFDVELADWGKISHVDQPFSLKNGLQQLSSYFTDIRLYCYEDALDVTEVGPLVDYILSGWAHNIVAGRQDQFKEFLSREMEARSGVFHITKDAGLFVSG